MFDNPHEDVRDIRFCSYLTQGITDKNRLNEIGLDLVDLLNGALRFVHDDVLKVELDSFFINVARVHNHPLLTASGDFMDLAAQSALQPEALHASPFQLINQVMSDGVVYVILKYMSYEQNCLTLYRIFETLKNIDADSLNIAG